MPEGQAKTARKPPVVLLAGVRWDFLWQRHQTLATLFARAGYPTVFVETTGLSSPGKSVYSVGNVLKRLRGGKRRAPPPDGPEVYSPTVLPPTRGVFREANRRLFVPRTVSDLMDMVGEPPVVVAYPPTRTTLDIISLLEPPRTLYDCSDEYASFPGVPVDIRETELELISRADLVSCTSAPLLERVRRARPDAFLSGPAVDPGPFIRVGPRDGTAGRIRRVGYFGHLGGDRLQLEVFRGIADAGYEVRVFGEIAADARGLFEHPRIGYAGNVPHPRLARAVAGVDAFVTPYREDTALTRGIFPAKTYEMLATGKPVLSTPLPSLGDDPDIARCVYFAGSVREYVSALESLTETESEETAAARLRVATANSWESRFRHLEQRLFPEAG